VISELKTTTSGKGKKRNIAVRIMRNDSVGLDSMRQVPKIRMNGGQGIVRFPCRESITREGHGSTAGKPEARRSGENGGEKGAKVFEKED